MFANLVSPLTVPRGQLPPGKLSIWFLSQFLKEDLFLPSLEGSVVQKPVSNMVWIIKKPPCTLILGHKPLSRYSLRAKPLSRPKIPVVFSCSGENTRKTQRHHQPFQLQVVPQFNKEGKISRCLVAKGSRKTGEYE